MPAGRHLPILMLAALVLAMLPLAASAQPSAGAVFVSEFHYDNDGTDTGEFVEVTAPAGTDLGGWSVVLYNGNGGTVYDTDVLSGVVTDEAAGYGTVVLEYPSNGLQNGAPDGIALVDASGSLVEFLSYEGTFTGVGGPADGVVSTDVGVEQGSTTPVGSSIERVGEVPGGWEWVADEVNSRGAPNPGSTIDGTLIPGEDPPPQPDECDTPGYEADTAIHAINTVGDDGLPDTTMFGERVSVEAVVTADFLDGLDGVFVQEEDGDADDDPTTSEGIFVYLPGASDGALAVGDLVCVTGTVGVFAGTYQLTDAAHRVVAADVDLPSATELVLPVTDRAELAQLAGMRVELRSETGSFTITQNFFLGQFGELDLSASGFLWHPAELHDPDSAAAAELREDNLNAMIKLDDADSSQNVTPNAWLDNGDLRAGSETFAPIVGVTHYQFDAYRIQPTAPDDIEFANTANPRPDGPPDVLDGAHRFAETVTVASFNVLNYFTTLGSRGADTPEEFERQAAKIVTAIVEMDADVVGLMEIENNFGGADDALLDLVERLNAATAPGTYAAVELKEPVGTDEISNAMIYQPDEVTPVGDLAIADHAAFVDPLGAGTDRNRPAIAQAFEAASGDVFVVVVNHLKSKGSGCGEVDPEDPIVGNCDLTRTAAAEELARWLEDDDPTGTGSDKTAIIGDLNAYAMEDPVAVLRDARYTDVLAEDAPTYTYTFDGEHGRLDHALVSQKLRRHVVDAEVWHINTDEPAAFDYNDWNDPAVQDDSEFRSSDHDPVLVGLAFMRRAGVCHDHQPPGLDRPGAPGRPGGPACPTVP